MNNIELNAILYYADFLSLKLTSTPVTDNCKYFYIHNTPINSAFILDMVPDYDEDNRFYKQAFAEYNMIKEKFGDEGVETFVEEICSIRACGSVDAIRMLDCIHLYSNKKRKKLALQTYYDWKSKQKYTHLITDEDGNIEEGPCTKYVFHAERLLGRGGVSQGNGTYA